MAYSQNNEETIIVNYFTEKHGPDFKGTLIDFGANDGRTFSNSLRLIQRGWKATLIEASKEVAGRCIAEHKGNEAVQVINIGVAEECGTLVFHESGEHVGRGDKSLVSTFDSRELKRWEHNTEFTQHEIEVVDWYTLQTMSTIKEFDFITMDIEGMETVVLPQIDLTNVKCLCIEYNSKPELLKYYKDIAKNYGLIELHHNAENVIFVK